MGRSVSLFQELSKIIAFNRLQGPLNTRRVSTARTISTSEPVKKKGVRAGTEQQHRQQQHHHDHLHHHPLRGKWMGENSGREKETRVPLSDVVSDCVRRWFHDTLKEANAGDAAMQVLVGQMYCSGYGVPRDAQKGRAWIYKASKIRSSALKVGDKRPGYNASDSDSDDTKEAAKLD